MDPENILSQHDQVAIEGDALEGYAREGAVAAEIASAMPQMSPGVEAHLIGILQKSIAREAAKTGRTEQEITRRIVGAVRLTEINETYKEQ